MAIMLISHLCTLTAAEAIIGQVRIETVTTLRQLHSTTSKGIRTILPIPRITILPATTDMHSLPIPNRLLLPGSLRQTCRPEAIFATIQMMKDIISAGELAMEDQVLEMQW